MKIKQALIFVFEQVACRLILVALGIGISVFGLIAPTKTLDALARTKW